MNQILSVEAPKKSKKRKVRENGGKASTKSVVIFFAVLLIVFGITLASLGVYTTMNKSNSNDGNNQVVGESKPRIDVVQNATELNIEITGQSEISKIEYKWGDGEIQEEEGNGTESLELSVNIPNGTNTFELTATDVNGNTNQYSKEFVGAEQSGSQGSGEENKPNIQLVELEGNKVQVICQEEKRIKYISYNYDNGEEHKQEVNDANAKIDIDVLEGEHTLTIKVGYEDGTVDEISNKLYVPIVKVTLDGNMRAVNQNGNKVVETDANNFVINATDVRNISNVNITFNGQEQPPIEDVNNNKFEKKIQLQQGENILILTVYNKDGGKIVKKYKCIKK